MKTLTSLSLRYRGKVGRVTYEERGLCSNNCLGLPSYVTIGLIYVFSDLW